MLDNFKCGNFKQDVSEVVLLVLIHGSLDSRQDSSCFGAELAFVECNYITVLHLEHCYCFICRCVLIFCISIKCMFFQQLDGSAGQTGGQTGGGNQVGSDGTAGGDDDDSSDDGSSYHDDDLDSSDEEDEEGAEGGKVKDLEWDNSTLAIQRGRIQGECCSLLSCFLVYILIGWCEKCKLRTSTFYIGSHLCQQKKFLLILI